MATAMSNSLFALPAELRVKIFRYLFVKTELSVTMCYKSGFEKCAPQASGLTSVDNGITLTCRLLRAEAMPILRQTISLLCSLEPVYNRPANLTVKSDYIKLIREAEFVFDGEDWDIPYHEMPSLELLRVECSGDGAAIHWEADHETYSELAKAGDVAGYIAKVQYLAYWDSSENVRKMLDNRDRGFTVEWRETIFDVLVEVTLVSLVLAH